MSESKGIHPEANDGFSDHDPCPIALDSPFRMETPNAPVQLFSGELEVNLGDTSIKGEGTIRAEWIPRSKISFRIPNPNKSFFSLFGKLGNAELRIPSAAASVKALVTECGSDGISGIINGRFKIGDAKALRRLSFHLTNFAPVLGRPVRSATGRHSWTGRMDWKTAQWQVRIDPLVGSHDLVKEIRKIGGFGITHIGQIERVDTGTFSSDEVEDLLQVIRHTLSFSAARWVSPVLLVGLDSKGGTVYQEWSNAILSEWNSTQTWFSDLLGDELEDLFKGFDGCWTDPIWRDALGRAVWWYVASHENAGGIDGSLILIQVALELMAWVVYVERGKIISKKGFEDLPAADKLRLLLQWMHVPSDVPPELPRLADFAKKEGCPIGPWVFTEIRNSLVHPKKRTLTKSAEGVLYEGRQLGMWYLELAVLFACQYRGKYLNRLKAKATWESEDVPWRTQTNVSR